MRASVFAVLMLAAATAHAQRVALATGDDQQRAALAVALGGRVDIAPIAPPNGAIRLDRAADAQRGALAIGASAAVWIDDGGEVCVVSADGATFRHAPLPGGDSPRVFAAIAQSLLDELLAPPEIPVRVDVHVELGAPAEFAPPPPPIAVEPAVTVQVAPPRPRRTLVEFGPIISPVSYGVEAEVAFPIGPFRIGPVASASQIINGGFNDQGCGTLAMVGGELRYSGTGTTHVDVGVAGGMLHVACAQLGIDDSGGWTALRVSVVREVGRSAVELSLGPVVIFGTRGNSPMLTGAFASARVAVGL